MGFLKKIFYLLTKKQKIQLIFLSLLLIIGFVFEILGLGIIIPALSIILDPEISIKYPVLKPIFEFLGNPTQTQLVLGAMLSIVLFYITKAFYFIFMAWKHSDFSTSLYRSISLELFEGYLNQPYIFHLKHNSALLIRNINVEAGAFLLITQSILTILTESTALLGMGIMLMIFEPIGTIIMISFLTLSAYSFEFITRKKLSYWGIKRQEYEGKWNQQLMQTLNGVKIIKLLGRSKYFNNIFSYINLERSKIIAKEYTLRQVPRLYLEVLSVFGLALLIIIEVLQNNSLEILIPILGMFATAAFRMMPSTNRLMNAISAIRFYSSSVNLIYDECRIIRDTKIPEPQALKLSFNNRIELANITFNYPDTNKIILDKISLTIKYGESIGFIGTSGSGKSTLLDIILGLLTPDAGIINVDGKNIQGNIQGWQKQIGYVPQLIHLTDDSIRKNIALGITDEKIDELAIKEAIQLAQLNDFVMGLPDGLNTYVGEQGVRLSGGQRQRIGIARALYYNPEILVLDEATSALDTDTEKAIIHTIMKLKRRKTILIVAHRTSTLSHCDRLFKIENGNLVLIS